MPVIPAVLSKYIWGAFLLIIGHLVFKILVALGMAVVTFKGVNIAFDWILDRGIQELSGLPAEMLGLLGLMNVGVCISMITSAITMKMVLRFASFGTIKRVFFG